MDRLKPSLSLKDELENLNPFSGKGILTFPSFAMILGATVFFNFIAYALVRSQLIVARTSLSKENALVWYGVWFLLSVIGFTSITNAFIKRWAAILGDRELGGFWKSAIRIGLLSPALALPICLVTFIFFPKSPVSDAGDGAPRFALLGCLTMSFVIGIAFTVFLPSSFFGLERAHFRQSIEPFVSYVAPNRQNPIPPDQMLKPLYAAASPGTRYLFWIGADFFRTRTLNLAIAKAPEKLCAEKLGYLEVEVQDCFFYRMRAMAKTTPMISPYFGLYFEAQYRTTVAELLKTDFESRLADFRSGIENPEIESQKIAMRGFANSLLMASNQLELLEPGPMFIRRTELLKPIHLLRAFGSPEIPFVEAGQDIQRISLLEKLLPVFEFQLSASEAEFSRVKERMGVGAISLESALRDLRIRLNALKKDPLMLGAG
jgi:hypothetical protein